jgi:leader peptidase (prepilin peptidase)/N-methyltransferase
MLYFLIILGLALGSFLSAVTYRIPRRISFVVGRSICPKCKKQIAWYDNIPLLSFALLNGKCRSCKAIISLRYPLIEIVTAVGFIVIWNHFQNFGILTASFYLLIFILSLILFVIDWEHQYLPDELTFLIFVLGILMFFVRDNGLFSYLFTGFLLSNFILVLNIITKGKGMGLGDVKLALGLGVFFSLGYGLVFIFLAFLTGALAGIILILARKAGLKSKVAFGPFLILSFWIMILWADKIIGNLAIG